MAKYFVIGLFMSAALAFSAAAVFAQTEESTLSISPLTFEIAANPGDVITNAVRVYNPGDSPLVIAATVEDFSPSGERGEAVVSAAESTSYSIAAWTQLETHEVALGPREQAVINFTLRVPLNAEPGGHYGAITLEARGGAIAGGAGTAIAQKVASLMLVAVAGDVSEQLVVSDFVGPDGVLLNLGSITFASRFENKGSVHLKPRGFVTVHDMFGKELASVSLDQNNVLPGTKRLIETTWKPEGFVFGRVNAQLTAIYGSTNEPLTASTEFWVIPIRVVGPIAGGLLLALVLGLLLRRRLALAFSVLVRGQRS